jgi:hypothetical protein
VLNAVAGELLDLAVVSAHREVDDQRAAGLLEALAQVVGQADRIGGALELSSRHAIELGAPLGARRNRVVLGVEDRLPSTGAAAFASLLLLCRR